MFNNLYLNYLYNNTILYLNNCIYYNLNFEALNNFIYNNKYILLFILIIYIGILIDYTFKAKNKLFILLYIVLLLFFLLFFKGSFFINEIFWYTLILNGSFIFHVCICDWLYRINLKMKNYYVCFIITRISFILSMSFIMYSLHIIYIYIDYYSDLSKYCDKVWFIYLIHTIFIIIYILLTISIFFIVLFTNYSLLLKGLYTRKLSIRRIVKIFIFVLITMVISVLILGIPRIYFIWLVLSIKFIYRLLHCYDFNFRYIYVKFPELVDFDLNHNIATIYYDYNKMNTIGFSYGFIEFINYLRTYNNYFKHEFHLRCPFVYYSREMLILTYLRSYFKLEIAIKNSISKYKYDCVFLRAVEDLHLNEDEREFFYKRIQKLYKKTLKI